ncbi:MAG TPA: tRNA (cytidine(34)-2'-O)-methyltransferase [Candidatus Tumulicola sp.]
MATQPHERITPLDALQSVPLHVALVEPEIPPNTGNVARLCAATGCALHLVEPLGFAIGDRELKRAGLDYWQHVRLTVHPSLDAFLEATASLSRWFVSTRGRMHYGEAPFARGDVLVFGKETRGLPAELLQRYAGRTLRIPMRDESVRSLNLSTSVGIVTYAALQRLGFPGLS